MRGLSRIPGVSRELRGMLGSAARSIRGRAWNSTADGVGCIIGSDEGSVAWRNLRGIVVSKTVLRMFGLVESWSEGMSDEQSI